MPEERARQSAARAWLHEHRLAALVVFNDGQNSFLDANAVYVFSGVRSLGPSCLVIPHVGPCVLVVTPAWDRARAQRLSATDQTVACADLAAGLGDILASAPIEGPVAVDTLSKQSRRLSTAVLRLFDRPPTVADGLAARLARIRSPEELACARKAVEIAERGYQRLLEVVRPGMREFELAAEIYCSMKELGAEDNFLLMSASQHNLAVRAAGGRVLERGDVILAEITPCCDGQFAQICRTAVLGRAAPELKEKYALLQEAMRRGMEAATPGGTIGEATRAMNEVFRSAGYGDYCRPPYMRVRGHGLGVTSNQPGDLNDANDAVFEEGMVFVMHPNQYIPETGYLMCGETVMISHNGAISLSDRNSQVDCVDP